MSFSIILERLISIMPAIFSFFEGIASKIIFNHFSRIIHEREEIKDFSKNSKNLELLEQFVSRANKGKIKLFSSTLEAINCNAPENIKCLQNFTNYEKEFTEKPEWFIKSVNGFELCNKLKRHKILIKNCILENDKKINALCEGMSKNAVNSLSPL